MLFWIKSLFCRLKAELDKTFCYEST